MVDNHLEKFSCSITRIEKFIRICSTHNNQGNTTCTENIHQLKADITTYTYDGEPYNLSSYHCSDVECFLSNLHPDTINITMDFVGKKNAEQHRDKNESRTKMKNIRKNISGKSSFWVCFTCDTKSENFEDLSDCKEKHHEVMKFPSRKDFDEANEKSHTEYAEEIMNDWNFLTLEDTDEVLVYENGVYRLGGEIILKQEAEKRVEQCNTVMRKEIINTVKARTYTKRDVFDQNPLKLNVKNGILNLETMELGEHSPLSPSRMQLNVMYDPLAGPKKFIYFMSEILKDYKDRTTIYELFSTALLRNFLNLEKIMMFVGEGQNGKSTLLRTMIEVFGKTNACHVSIHDLIYNRFTRSVLDGKMLNVYADISNDEIDKMRIIKSLVTGEPVTVEKKNKPLYTLENQAKMFYSCNRLPEVNEDSDSIYRRFSIIHFLQQFKGVKTNTKLFDELTTEEEKSGILNLLLFTAKKMIKTRRLSYDTTTEQLRREWKERADPVQNFSNICIKIQNANHETKSDVYSEYVKFCKDRDMIPRSTQAFTERMKNLGYKDDIIKIMKKTTRVWVDIRLEKKDNYKLGLSENPSDDSPSTQGISTQENTLDSEISSDEPEKKWFKCITCDAGPWSEGYVGSGGVKIVEFHTSQDHDVVDCTQDGKPI